jgi:hypothetical protein
VELGRRVGQADMLCVADHIMDGRLLGSWEFLYGRGGLGRLGEVGEQGYDFWVAGHFKVVAAGPTDRQNQQPHLGPSHSILSSNPARNHSHQAFTDPLRMRSSRPPSTTCPRSAPTPIERALWATTAMSRSVSLAPIY